MHILADKELGKQDLTYYAKRELNAHIRQYVYAAFFYICNESNRITHIYSFVAILTVLISVNLYW